MKETASETARAAGDHASWAVIALLFAAVGTLQLRSPLAVVPWGLLPVAFACTALASAAWFYRRVRIREDFSVMCVALIQVLLFTAIGSIFSYMLARSGGGLWDARLQQWDRAIGFDWLAFARFIDSTPVLIAPLRLAYASLIPQILVVLLALGFSRRLTELRRVMLAAILTGSITIVASSFFPAVSNYVHLGLTQGDFQHIQPWAGYVHLADFNALRDGSFGTVRLREMQGIVTFPSYHAALATVTMWGFWVSRLSWVRWPGSAVAVATIVATPVDGGHYLVDVIAGMAIAIACIFATRFLVYWELAGASVRASPFRRLRAASAQ